MWDQRASITGIMFLCVCLVGAAGYKQAPLAEVTESTSGKEGGGDGSSGSGSNGNGKKRGKGVMYVVLLVAAGATVGLFVKQNASSLPPAPAPLVPPSAAPYVPEPLPQKAHAHGGAHGGAGAGLRHNQVIEISRSRGDRRNTHHTQSKQCCRYPAPRASKLMASVASVKGL